MPAQYLIRFDDICPTMNWNIWNEIENILIDTKIVPILAVVPDNRDEELVVDRANEAFWSVVRSWQKRGWTIGIHGYQHRYVTHDGGLLGIKRESEFAGLQEAEQELKLANAMAVFRGQEVTPQVWVAPGHSFDGVTLRLLRKVNINVVSDGLYVSPNTDSLGIIHIPQQLWRFRRVPFGLWTVCYHHNRWTNLNVERFAADVRSHKTQITSLPSVLASYRRRNRNLFDEMFSLGCTWALQSRAAVRKVMAREQRSAA
jgi:predicted deacetylase